jgi:imidazolonepropionase-like amidohydrolase
VRHGARSIEHGIFLDDEAIELMLLNGTWLVPTLHAVQSLLTAIDEGASYPQAVVDKVHLVATAHEESIARAHAAGVKIAMGTDCGVGQHGTNLTELELMNKVGLSPLEALHATTGSAAELLGVDSDLGRIAPGMRADLVVVDGSPTDLTAISSRLRDVYLDGLLVARP